MEIYDASPLPETCRALLADLNRTYPKLAADLIRELQTETIEPTDQGFKVTPKGITHVLYMLDDSYIPEFLELMVNEEEMYRLAGWKDGMHPDPARRV